MDLFNRLKNSTLKQPHSGIYFGVSASSGGAQEFMSATGGDITTVGDYKIHTFTSVGTTTFTPTIGSDGTYGSKIDYVIVAGGGGGYCGGGGAGGLLTATNLVLTNTDYTMTVGDGGYSGQCNVNAYGGNGVGGLSSIAGTGLTTITSTGGGFGGNHGGNTNTAGGSAGGGGGGGGAVAGGTSTSSPNQGNNGGSYDLATRFYSSFTTGSGETTQAYSAPHSKTGSHRLGNIATIAAQDGYTVINERSATLAQARADTAPPTDYWASDAPFRLAEVPNSNNSGGGGGAGAVGSTLNGGAGIANPITGSVIGEVSSGTYYLAGGGAGANTSSASGGSGGVGGGGDYNAIGTATFGGGGGGADSGRRAAVGGSGVIIIKYKFQ
tara:strand:+ start:306 stop:1448 length:1143 start_codon:yes stop_codon:yes gene_type:complete